MMMAKYGDGGHWTLPEHAAAVTMLEKSIPDLDAMAATTPGAIRLYAKRVLARYGMIEVETNDEHDALDAEATKSLLSMNRESERRIEYDKLDAAVTSLRGFVQRLSSQVSHLQNTVDENVVGFAAALPEKDEFGPAPPSGLVGQCESELREMLAKANIYEVELGKPTPCRCCRCCR